MLRKLSILLIVAILFAAPDRKPLHAAPEGVCVEAVGVPAAAGGKWEKRTAMPLFRSEIASATLDGKIYVAGGLAGKSFFFSGISASFEVYDPAGDSWKELAALPKPLHHVGLAAAHGHIYLTGGYDALDFIPRIKEAWAYDPKSDSWSAIAPMPAPRAAHTMAVIDDQIYLVGGVTGSSTALWTCDPATDHWNSAHQPMPTAREHLASAVISGKLYALGGEVPNSDGTGNETSQRLATVEVYDPAKDSWAKLRDMPIPRNSITAAVINGQLHVVSGEDVDDKCVFAEHDVYDPAADSWTTMADLATPRHGAVSGVVDNRWYVIGGAIKPGLLTIAALSNTVEAFIPAHGP